MQRRAVIYISAQSHAVATSDDLADRLTRAVAARGDIVVATFPDDSTARRGRGRRSGWKTLLRSLDGLDLVAVGSAADLPGRTVTDLLRLLETLRDHGVGLLMVAEGIDTRTGSNAFLDLIAAYRAAKLSQAIRAGQARCGKRIGRPEVPEIVRRRIEAAIVDGAGVRATARRFAVSGGTVINIRRSMTIHAGVGAG